MRLPLLFYQRDTLLVARELLGKEFLHTIGGKRVGGLITETEAYIGVDDPACHAARGMTPRTEVMFGRAGHAYVYFIYGMYHCVNFITERDGFPAAVLIRAIAPTRGVDLMARRRYGTTQITQKQKKNIANGPGKLCMAMDIHRGDNKKDLLKDSLGVYDVGTKISKKEVLVTSRIGIAVGRDLPWRFVWQKDKH